jgi:hypothetical protein
MIRVLFFFSFLILGSYSYSQKQQVTWGEEFKLKKGSGDINVLFSDETGVYVEEEHITMGTYFVVGYTVRESATLVKLDHRLQEVYRSDFNQELKGKNFENFLPIQDKLWIIASEYNRGLQELIIHIGEINKKSGQMMGAWKTLASLPKADKKDQIKFRLFPNADSSKLILISTSTGKEKNTFQIQEFDAKMKPSSKVATISNEFESKTYQLEDVMYTKDKRIILVGRVFTFETGKKKKSKFLDFVNYNIRLYDEKGKQTGEINTNINGKWIASTKLMLGKNDELLLASFYSKEKKGKTNGLLVQRIDPLSGNVISSAEKEINHSMVMKESGENEEVDEDESKAERKERERMAKLENDEEGFSSFMKFRDIFYTQDKGLVIMAENYRFTIYESSHYYSGTSTTPSQRTNTVIHLYECGEVVACKLDSANQISWLQVLPKAQKEYISESQISSGGGPGLSVYFSNFFFPDGRPYYAGFMATQKNDQILLYFNDHHQNANVTNANQSVSKITKYAKSDCYLVKLDIATGTMKRNLLFSNDNQPTAMPRKGTIIGKNLYMVGKTDRMIGKTKIAIGKITSK